MKAIQAEWRMLTKQASRAENIITSVIMRTGVEQSVIALVSPRRVRRRNITVIIGIEIFIL